MANERQQQIYKQQKIRALLGLLIALSEGGIPDTPGVSLRSGQIIECLDDQFLRVPKKAMLEALQDTGVPHDINNRFTRPMLHAYEEQLEEQYRVYLREQGYKFPVPDVVVTGDSQEA